MRVQSKHMANKYAEPNNFKQMTDVDKATGITLILIAAIIPIIVKYALVPVGPEQNIFFNPEEKAADMFSYYKSIYILISSGILFLCIIGYRFSERLSYLYNWKNLLKNPFSISFIVFLLTIVISSIFSEYQYTVTHGIYERYESAFILLSYLVIFAAVVLFARSAFQFRFLLCGLLFSCLIIGLIGTFQFFKMDFFMTEIANQLVLNSENFKNGVRLTTPFPNQSYTTLYNPNSVGSYTVLMLPITALGAVYYNRGIIMRIWFIICGAVMLFTAIGCNSAAGIAGLVVSAVVLFVVFVHYSYKKGYLKKLLLGVSAGLAVVIIAIMFISPIRTRLLSVSKKLFHWSSAANSNLNPGASSNFFTDMGITDATVEIKTANGSIFLANKSESLLVSYGDSVLTPVSTEENAENYSVIHNYSVPGLGDFVIEEVSDAFALRMQNIAFLFGYDENKAIIPMSNLFQPIDINKPIETFGFKGMESWGSGRGYIWSRTFPLLKNRIFLGSGPDTYMIVFPQDDIIGKVRYWGKPYIMVDKAHNLFLQTGVNTGVISMLALTFIFAWFIVTNFLLVLKGPAPAEEKWLFGMRVGIFAGVCGYMVVSLATDSTVSVSPVFWIVLGLGAALQRRLARE